jgi:histidinol-phosphate/aromatic aminotransferase/cobyric acid decarboxylase-like protein/CTP:phosphocholine cytidylyltransferase-like protein
MQAIILAAGMGARLGSLTENNTKAMIEINNVPIIERLVNQILESGIEKIIVVVGYQRNGLISFLNKRFPLVNFIFVVNEDYAKTNNIYSLFLAKEYLENSDTVIFESDLVLSSNIISNLLNANEPDLVLLAKYESWMDGTVVELDENLKILNFISGSKFDFFNKKNLFKTVNLYKFSKAFSIKHYVPFLHAYITSCGDNVYYEDVLKVISFLSHTDLKGFVLSENDNWYEIDDKHDILNANAIFSNPKDNYENISRRFGGYWRFPKLIDFCYLVNPYFPPQRLIDELKSNFEDLLCNYPSGQHTIKILASKNFKIREEFLIVGNGGAELIKGFADGIRDFDKKQKVGIFLPTFEEYIRQFTSGFEILYFDSAPFFKYNLEDVLTFFDKVDILILINPDNPSGNFLSKDDVFKILDFAALKSKKILIDESFIDFAEESKHFTLLKDEILLKYSCLYVLKSISKSYGVPGLRLGIIATSDTLVLNSINNNLSIWNINSFAEYYLQICQKFNKEYIVSNHKIALSRFNLINDLMNIDFIHPFPSQANYILCKLNDGYSTKLIAHKLLSEFNILIKDCSDKLGFDSSQFIRLAVRDEIDNRKLVEALKSFSTEL